VDLAMKFTFYILLTVKVPVSVVVHLQRVGLVLTETSGDHPAIDHRDAANRCAAKVAHLCHVTGVGKEPLLAGGGRESVD
jgi:Glu-tRNA(Gln) amidotransferase subunit E-like FAD-binding protein